MDIKHPFIRLEHWSIEDHCDCSRAILPVKFGSDLAIRLPLDILPPWGEQFSMVDYLSASWHTIHTTNISYDDENPIVHLSDDLSNFLAKGDCFRLQVQTAGGVSAATSNLFMYVGCEAENTLLFEYWGYENERFKIRLPAVLYNPNPIMEKEEYTDGNGFVSKMKTQRRKQFELEFDFLPKSLHDSIQEMLSFPNLEIDGTRYFESGDYRIEWEQEDERGFAKASTQLSEQEVIRFVNCQ